MELLPQQRIKADGLLIDSLAKAEPRQIVRALVFVACDSDLAGKGQPVAVELRPSDFASRLEYRRALIDRKRRQSSGRNMSTLKALADLSLNPRGGTIGGTVVIEGPAGRVAEALLLPGVKKAVLDREISLVEPRRPTGRE